TTTCLARSVKRSNTPERLAPQAVDANATERRRPRLDRPALACALEEPRLERPARIREQHLRAEPREELEELVDVPSLVEEVRREHEIPRRALEERLRIRPSDESRLERGAV